MRTRLLSRFIVVLMLVSSGSVLKAQLKLLSGLEGGTYFHLANDIKGVSSQPLEVLNSNGSVDNYNQLVNNNSIRLTFLQYDVLLTNELLNPEIRNELRVLFPLFLDEEIHLITRKDSEIKSLSDLKEKKVGVGTKDQGTHVTAATIKRKTGIKWSDIIVSSNEAYEKLMAGEIDAYFYVGGAPVSSLSELGEDANLKLIDISHNSLKEIYTRKSINKGTYKWQDKKVNTFAVPTLIVVNIKDITKEEEKAVNMLRTDINKNIQNMQKNGHKKWVDVYLKNQNITWPYYYQRGVVE